MHVAEMKEVDVQMSEKVKPLKTYELQRKNLELSVNEVFKALNASIGAVREKSEDRMKLKENIGKLKEEMVALEVAVKKFDYKATRLEEAAEQPIHFSPGPSGAEIHLKYISGILEEKAAKCCHFESQIALLNREIKEFIKEITEQRNSLIKEHQLLLSKCQQIHQLQGVTGLLNVRVNACGMKIDQTLQQKFAANSMFKSSVFQVINKPILYTAVQQHLCHRLCL